MTKILEFYWCIKVKEEISPDKEIYLYADTVENIKGDLIFKDKKGSIVFSIAKGMWNVLFAASCIDGAAVVVEHWKGEVNRKK